MIAVGLSWAAEGPPGGTLARALGNLAVLAAPVPATPKHAIGLACHCHHQLDAFLPIAARARLSVEDVCDRIARAPDRAAAALRAVAGASEVLVSLDWQAAPSRLTAGSGRAWLADRRARATAERQALSRLRALLHETTDPGAVAPIAPVARGDGCDTSVLVAAAHARAIGHRVRARLVQAAPWPGVARIAVTAPWPAFGAGAALDLTQ